MAFLNFQATQNKIKLRFYLTISYYLIYAVLGCAEQLSVPKTKTKVIILANHKGRKQYKT